MDITKIRILLIHAVFIEGHKAQVFTDFVGGELVSIFLEGNKSLSM